MSVRVLILCTHNSARSILAEAMLNHLASISGTDVQAYSAGSAPKGHVNPLALQVLNQAGIDTTTLASKTWEVFAQQKHPPMDIVITVCDSAAAETCPVWPGAPLQMHWGFPDPSNAPGTDSDRLTAFELTRQAIGFKMLQLVRLPFQEMTQQELKSALNRIANS